jgi:hypothetical protein
MGATTLRVTALNILKPNIKTLCTLGFVGTISTNNTHNNAIK